MPPILPSLPKSTRTLTSGRVAAARRAVPDAEPGGAARGPGALSPAPARTPAAPELGRDGSARRGRRTDSSPRGARAVCFAPNSCSPAAEALETPARAWSADKPHKKGLAGPVPPEHRNARRVPLRRQECVAGKRGARPGRRAGRSRRLRPPSAVCGGSRAALPGGRPGVIPDTGLRRLVAASKPGKRRWDLLGHNLRTTAGRENPDRRGSRATRWPSG